MGSYLCMGIADILGKTQVHETSPDETEWTKAYRTTYDLTYEEYNTAEYNVAGYSYTQPHAVRQITDKPEAAGTGNDVKTKLYDYDANGNLTHITQKTGESQTIEKLRTNLWDEENRLRAVDITPDAEGVRPIAIYTYDAGGERTLKHSNTSVSIYLNGKMVADTIQTDATLYPSGMLVAKLGNNGSEEEQTLAYTKHYYAGTQRVSSKIGTTENLGDFLQDWYTGGLGGPVDVLGSSNQVIVNAEQGVIQVYDELEIEAPEYSSNPIFYPVQSFTHGANENEIYWFHPDHLGSTSYISNVLGEVSQHMEYFAFGETFVEEHKSSNNSPYKFNGKELDEETGLYYYGARYYDPRVSVWLSVDPLAEKAPGWSPYSYTFNNPISFFDPDGRWPYPIVIRSFHPAASFGGGRKGLPPTWNGKGYSGDNRGFSLNNNASSRIHHRVVADPQEGTVTYAGRGKDGTYSDPSHHPTQGTATDIPDGYIGRVRGGDNSVSFETGYSGTNPLASGPTPAIDVDAIIKLSQDGDILNINAQVAGDNFPNTEAFITDPSGQKLFIGTDVRAPGEDNSPTILFGPATEHIMNVNLNVKTDPKTGNFISVQQGKEWISIQDYNKQHLEKDPNP